MQELEKILEEIEAEFERRIGTQLKIMAGLSDDVYRYGYGKSLEAYQQGKLFVEDIIRKHMNDGKCGECSRRKWYQKGFEDGSKNNDSWVSVDDRLPEDAESKKGKRQRMTNADRVRQMDDDELADFIIKGCIGEKRACCSHDETVEWLRWEDSISNGEG